MAPEFEYRVREDVSLRGALLVVGFPSPGYVSQVVTRFLVESQKLPHVGDFSSAALPPTVTVEAGVPRSPFRLHAGPEACGLDREFHQLAVLVGDAQLPEPLRGPLMRSLVDWAEAQGVSCIVPLEAVPHADRKAHESRVSFASSQSDFAGRLVKRGVEPLDGVLVSGTTAALLAEGLDHDVVVVGLFAEAHNDFHDAQAAAALARVIDQLLLHIPIDVEPLLERAQALTEQVRRTVDRSQTGTMMYG